MVMNRRGQLKIQQMMFMLMAVTFLFVLVGLFFLAIRLNNVQKSANVLQQEGSMLLVSKLANSPEFSCGNAYGSSRANCVDFEKIMNIREKEEYYTFWGVAKIEVRKLYPESDENCDSDTYPECGIIKILDKNVNTLPFESNFVSLCRKESVENFIYDKCELALLMVASEDKSETE